MDVVCLQFLHKGRIASEIVVVIPDHHGHLDARAGAFELVVSRVEQLEAVAVELLGPAGTEHRQQLPIAALHQAVFRQHQADWGLVERDAVVESHALMEAITEFYVTTT